MSADRVPTEAQHEMLSLLGVGVTVISGMSGKRRLWKSLLKHGWVEAERPEIDPENGFRVTPDGLRALALSLERYGHPKRSAKAERRETRQIVQLRQARDEARGERDTARRDIRRLESRVRAAKRALQEAPS